MPSKDVTIRKISRHLLAAAEKDRLKTAYPIVTMRKKKKKSTFVWIALIFTFAYVSYIMIPKPITQPNGNVVEESKTIIQPDFNPCKDKRCEVGSQSETASFTVDDSKIIHVEGYQQYDLKDGLVNIRGRHKNKFNFLKAKLAEIMINVPDAKTFLDIGCGAGMTSLLANELGFEHVTSLDHDSEYIRLVKDITVKDGIDKSIDPMEFSFGDPFPVKADVVFMGALIHWVFTCTADFSSFDLIMDYLKTAVDKVLLIEWEDPKDSEVKAFNHDKCGAAPKEPYAVEGFEKALGSLGTVVDKWELDGPYRVLYRVDLKQKTD